MSQRRSAQRPASEMWVECLEPRFALSALGLGSLPVLNEVLTALPPVNTEAPPAIVASLPGVDLATDLTQQTVTSFTNPISDLTAGILGNEALDLGLGSSSTSTDLAVQLPQLLGLPLPLELAASLQTGNPQSLLGLELETAIGNTQLLDLATELSVSSTGGLNVELDTAAQLLGTSLLDLGTTVGLDPTSGGLGLELGTSAEVLGASLVDLGTNLAISSEGGLGIDLGIGGQLLEAALPLDVQLGVDTANGLAVDLGVAALGLLETDVNVTVDPGALVTGGEVLSGTVGGSTGSGGIGGGSENGPLTLPVAPGDLLGASGGVAEGTAANLIALASVDTTGAVEEIASGTTVGKTDAVDEEELLTAELAKAAATKKAAAADLETAADDSGIVSTADETLASRVRPLLLAPNFSVDGFCEMVAMVVSAGDGELSALEAALNQFLTDLGEYEEAIAQTASDVAPWLVTIAAAVLTASEIVRREVHERRLKAKVDVVTA